MKKELVFVRADFASSEAWNKFLQVNCGNIDDSWNKDENGNHECDSEFSGNVVTRTLSISIYE